MKFKKGDRVLVVNGKYKDKCGIVTTIFPNDIIGITLRGNVGIGVKAQNLIKESFKGK